MEKGIDDVITLRVNVDASEIDRTIAATERLVEALNRVESVQKRNNELLESLLTVLSRQQA